MLAQLLLATSILSGPTLEAPTRAKVDVVRPVDIRAQQKLVVRAAAVTKLPKRIGTKQKKALGDVVAKLREGHDAAAKEAWEAFAKAHLAKSEARDVDALVRWVLRESYIETNEALRARASKVAYYNEQKEQLREHLKEQRKALRGFDGKGNDAVTVRTIRLRRRYKAGTDPVLRGKARRMKQEQLEKYVVRWEQKLASVGDDAQLANIDLQNALQKQQQTLQMMSNISKMLHDSAKSIIQNMKV